MDRNNWVKLVSFFAFKAEKFGNSFVMEKYVAEKILEKIEQAVSMYRNRLKFSLYTDEL